MSDNSAPISAFRTYIVDRCMLQRKSLSLMIGALRLTNWPGISRVKLISGDASPFVEAFTNLSGTCSGRC